MWDFDGVIADTFQLAFDIIRTHDSTMTEEAYRMRFHGNINKARQPQDLSAEDFFNAYGDGIIQRALFDDVADQIQTISNTYPCIIVSSTTSSPIATYLTHHGIRDCFAQILGNDVSHSKAEKFQMVYQEFKTSAQKCIFITDTLGDIREATSVGMPTIAVTWGFHDRATLEKGAPHSIVETPSELSPVVRDYLER